MACGAATLTNQLVDVEGRQPCMDPSASASAAGLLSISQTLDQIALRLLLAYLPDTEATNTKILSDSAAFRPLQEDRLPENGSLDEYFLKAFYTFRWAFCSCRQHCCGSHWPHTSLPTPLGSCPSCSCCRPAFPPCDVCCAGAHAGHSLLQGLWVSWRQDPILTRRARWVDASCNAARFGRWLCSSFSAADRLRRHSSTYT